MARRETEWSEANNTNKCYNHNSIILAQAIVKKLMGFRTKLIPKRSSQLALYKL